MTVRRSFWLTVTSFRERKLARQNQDVTDAFPAGHVLEHAINLVAEQLLHRGVSCQRFFALGGQCGRNGCNNEMIPLLIGCLNDRSEYVRLATCKLLLQMGKDAAAAGEVLLGLSKNANDPSIPRAAKALLDDQHARK